MKYYSIQDAPVTAGDVVFRESVVNKAVAFAVGVTLLAGGVYAVWRTHVWWFCIPLAFLALFPLMMGATLRHALHGSNWLVRCQTGGVLIKMRSYLNEGFPAEDLVIFELAAGEIEWAGQSLDRVILTRGSDDNRDMSKTYLDIKPRNIDLAGLEARLREERQRRGEHSSWLVYPVRVTAEGVIRITWRAESSWITPQAGRALEVLSQRLGVPVREPQKRVSDLTAAADRAGQEQLILELAENGDTISAVKAVRKLYGYSLAEARQFVEELAGRAQPAGRARE